MQIERLRLKAAWLSALPFFLLARPTGSLLLTGAAVGAFGVFVRAWAAGSIAKSERLTTTGPYAHLRHPLYAGTLFVGLGLTLAGGHWIWPLLFLAFYAVVYTRVMRRESAALSETFGAEYRGYADQVPALLPRLTPFPSSDSRRELGFTMARYRRNREWETLVGFLAAWSLLAGKWWWGG